jgi:hypothetical protein
VTTSFPEFATARVSSSTANEMSAGEESPDETTVSGVEKSFGYRVMRAGDHDEM